MTKHQWDFKVRGYASAAHPTAPTGALLLETGHDGEHSRDIEVNVWKARMLQGHVSRVEVTDMRTHETKTIHAHEVNRRA